MTHAVRAGTFKALDSLAYSMTCVVLHQKRCKLTLIGPILFYPVAVCLGFMGLPVTTSVLRFF